MRRLLFIFGVLALFVLDADAQFFRNLVKDAVKEATGVEINSNNSTSARSKQKPDEVSLVVSGQGGTKEEATNRALLSAIEQAYGVYVSANTSILNDDVIKDEIVTVSRGNIKEYKILSENTLSTGGVDVSLSAVVSTSKLISYAQSKGAQTEFAGATFGKEMKIRKLRQENTAKAMVHLLLQLKLMLHNSYELALDTAEPQSRIIDNEECALIKCKVSVTPNREILKRASELIYNTLSQLALSDSEIESYKKNNSEYNIFPFQTSTIDNYTDSYQKRKVWEYGSNGSYVSNKEFTLKDDFRYGVGSLNYGRLYKSDILFYLPISIADHEVFREQLDNIYMGEFYNLCIIDNKGAVSKFKSWGNYAISKTQKRGVLTDYYLHENYYNCYAANDHEGLISKARFEFRGETYYNEGRFYYDVHDILKNFKRFKGTWEFYLAIPMSEIEQYSGFNVEHVSDND